VWDVPVVQPRVRSSPVDQFQRCQRSDIANNIREHDVPSGEGSRDNLALVIAVHLVMWSSKVSDSEAYHITSGEVDVARGWESSTVESP